MTPSLTSPSFFVTGGTLTLGAASYIVRQADTDLLTSLLAGEFCYVLNSRGMGKSSLMVRTSERLREQGVTVAVLDLQAIGQNVSVEQWYDGLLLRLGAQLRLEDVLEDFWDDHPRFGPLQRFFEAIRQVALPSLKGRLVIFVDEIDVVRSLPFSADEFFAGIRQCYVGRAQEDALNRLCFCLLGTATPADLIQDTRISPFNIGKRIEVQDFTEAEAAPLAQELGENGQALLERVLYWTGGHPYLTQSLSRSVAESQSRTAAEVDALCSALFLTHQAQETDHNLMFVRDRLLKSEVDLAGLLELYGRMRRGKRVRYEETDPLCPVLRLSGVSKVVDDLLRVRNRIYERVFDQKWVVAHMPDAELRRQKAAFRRGMLRTSAVFVVVVTVIGSLALQTKRTADRFKRTAEKFAAIASLQGMYLWRAKDERGEAAGLLYVADMNLAQQEIADRNIPRALELLKSHRIAPSDFVEPDRTMLVESGFSHEDIADLDKNFPPPSKPEDFRSFEWRYLWQLCRNDRSFTLRGPADAVTAVAFSPDGKGKWLLTGSKGGAIQRWDAATGRETASVTGHTPEGFAMAFSPDGKTLALGCQDKTVRLLDTATGQETRVLRDYRWKSVVAFSPDGKTLAVAANDDTVRLWDTATGKEWNRLAVKADKFARPVEVNCLVFSPDGKTLAAGCNDGRLALWKLVANTVKYLPGIGGGVVSVVYSPDGKTLAASYFEGGVQIWEERDRVFSLKAHQGPASALAFSPDSKLLATGSVDKTIELWNIKLEQKVASLKGNTAIVNIVVFSPDGNTLVSFSRDKTVRFWRAATWAETDTQ